MSQVIEIKSINAEWNDPVLPLQVAKNLLAQPHHHLLAVGEGVEVAYVFANLMPHAAGDVLTLFTHPQHRRQGHARNLINALIDKAKKVECRALTLEVRSSNAAARKLYESMSFHKLVARPGYYSNPQEDAVVYSRNLG